MVKKVLVILAQGFEEIEAVVIIDILRRAELEVISAVIGEDMLVAGSRGISVMGDIKLKDFRQVPDALVLPGGGQGAENLAASELVDCLVKKCAEQHKIIAAICAAPAYVLAKGKVLSGRKATCYPADKNRFGKDVIYTREDVVIDENIITGEGVGAVFKFSLAIVSKLVGEEIALKVKNKALIK